jgi:thioester reductase-like protein
VHVYRFGEVLPSTASGRTNDRSLWHLLLRACVEFGVCPDAPLRIEGVTADHVGAVVARRVCTAPPAALLHVGNNPATADSAVVLAAVAELGVPLRPVGLADFIRRVTAAAEGGSSAPPWLTQLALLLAGAGDTVDTWSQLFHTVRIGTAATGGGTEQDAATRGYAARLAAGAPVAVAAS